MKKKSALPFIVLVILLFTLSFSSNIITGKAAGVNAMSKVLSPPTVIVYQHQNDHFQTFRWKIEMFLGRRSYWVPSTTIPGKAKAFKGRLHVSVGPVSKITVFTCDVIGDIAMPASNEPVSFKTGYLACNNMPSIKEIALSPALGYEYPIHQHEDFRDAISNESTANLQVTVRTTGGFGSIFTHPSMKLSLSSSYRYSVDIFDDRGRSPITNSTGNTTLQYDSTAHNSSPMPVTTSGALSILTFELHPQSVYWRLGSTLPTTNIRAGKNFAWYMEGTPNEIFTIGKRFSGSIGDLIIDPRTSQITGTSHLPITATPTRTRTRTPTRTPTTPSPH